MRDDLKALAAYIADYINEEQKGTNTEVDQYMVQNAIEAFQGGAADEQV